MAFPSGRNCPKCKRSFETGAMYCTACGTPLASTAERLQAALGSDYQLMGELGRGGFAIVYSVRDLKHRRYLAVKAMRHELMTSRVVVERFRREAQYVAALDHPNILSVAFAGEQASLVYYAMPRVRGKALSKLLETERKPSLGRAIRLLQDVGAGLSHAHERGVIHRDVKPSNIMVEEGGRAMVADFGIAKALAAGRTSLSLSGEIIGTPEYMSPEQATGEKDLDHRTDIYSWGVVGFELLTGRTPFAGGSTQSIVHRQMWEQAPDVRELAPGTPPAVAEALARCLAKAPADRWQSIAAAVEACLGGLP